MAAPSVSDAEYEEILGKLSKLGLVFEMRYREAWTLASKGKREEAEKLAAELLMEPRLGPIHKAGMRMLLATSSQDDFLDHARNELGWEEVLADAKVVLERARGDQSAIDREISKKLTTMTMSQLHDAQIQKMHEREAGQTNMRFLARLTLTDLFGESRSWATAVAGRCRDKHQPRKPASA